MKKWWIPKGLSMSMLEQSGRKGHLRESSQLQLSSFDGSTHNALFFLKLILLISQAYNGYNGLLF